MAAATKYLPPLPSDPDSDIDDVRMTWNTWPRTKLESSKCAIAIAIAASIVPLRPIMTSPVPYALRFLKSIFHPSSGSMRVGFVTFGTQVHVRELGFEGMSKVYVFRGEKAVSKEKVMEQRVVAGEPGLGMRIGDNTGWERDGVSVGGG
ncbi:hypothetical protein Droror1_Dr00006956 [Drosera rotundifolia]